MGRWAQAARRGGRQGAGGALGAPPAPLLTTVPGFGVCTAQGDDDTGGFYQFQVSLVEPYEFSDYGGPVAWYATGGFWEEYLDPDGWYRATEIGNGTTYSGISDYSNVLHLVAS